jgi:cytochrome bd-type quinol oxidase subunit 2
MKTPICQQLIRQKNKKKILFGTVLAIFLLVVLLPGVIYAQGVTIPSDTGLPQGSDLKTVVENFMKWILQIFGFLGIIAFIISGIMYLTSGGDKERAESAKKAMNYSIIGVIVGLAGYVIIQAVESLMKGGSNF